MHTTNRHWIVIATLVAILAAPLCAAAHNKVVVIPLGDSEKAPGKVERTLLFSASELSSGAARTSTGISFSNTFVPATSAANLVIKRPADWDGTSPIKIELFTRGVSTGSDRFFVRPRDFDDGDTFVDAFAVPSGVRNYTENGQFRTHTINFDASSLPKQLWFLVVQRDTTSGSNTGDITLLSMAITYTADY